MKKIVLVLMMLTGYVYGQYTPPYTPMSSSYEFKKYMRVDSGFVLPNFTDTTVANTFRVKNIPGAMIMTGNDIWTRNDDLSAWLQLVNVGAGSTSLIATPYSIFGNQSGSYTEADFYTNPYADSLKRSSDSVYRRVNGVWRFQYKDSVGGGGSLMNGSGLTFATDHYDLGGTLTGNASIDANGNGIYLQDVGTFDVSIGSDNFLHLPSDKEWYLGGYSVADEPYIYSLQNGGNNVMFVDGDDYLALNADTQLYGSSGNNIVFDAGDSLMLNAVNRMYLNADSVMINAPIVLENLKNSSDSVLSTTSTGRVIKVKVPPSTTDTALIRTIVSDSLATISTDTALISSIVHDSIITIDPLTRVIVSDSLTALRNAQPLTLVQIISQSSTTAPVVEAELVNTTGDTYTWSRNSGGYYTISATGSPFVNNKTFVTMTCGGGPSTAGVSYNIASTGTIDIYTTDISAGALSDNILSRASLKIEIYP